MLAVLAAALAVSGCRSVRRGDAIGRPVAKASAEVERGRVVFQQHCYRCHPGGEGGLGPSLNDKPAPAFLVRTQVRAGLGAMPGLFWVKMIFVLILTGLVVLIHMKMAEAKAGNREAACVTAGRDRSATSNRYIRMVGV